MSYLSSKQLDTQRELTIRHLLPDICQIREQHGTMVVSPAGIPTSSPGALRVWRTLTSIPCRVDYSRAFRPGGLAIQVATVNEYILELPFDIVFEESDRAIIEGEVFVMRKVKNKSEYDTTVEVILSKLGVTNATI